MIAVLENEYIEKLDKIIDKYNNTNHRSTKMKPPVVMVDTYIDYGFDHARISILQRAAL